MQLWKVLSVQLCVAYLKMAGHMIENGSVGEDIEFRIVSAPTEH